MAPRGLRNNNPGNIRNSQRTEWQGEVKECDKKDNSFEEFEDMEHGYRALIKLLQNYRRRHGCRTIADFINRWAPTNENDTAAYIKSVCYKLDVPTSYQPDVEDCDTMCALAAAISEHENGVKADMNCIRRAWDLL